MEPKEYVKNVLITESKDKTPLIERFSQFRSIRLLHGVIGLASELAEIREMADKKEIDVVNLKEEMGDLYWYMGIIVDELKIDPNLIFSNEQVEGLTAMQDKEIALKQLGWAVDAMTINIGYAIDLLKKNLVYGKPLDEQKFCNKLYSIDFNISHALFLYGITPSQARERNIEKLRARYGEKFTEAAALERNLDAERAILEQK